MNTSVGQPTNSRGVRRCGHCRQTGHDRRNCPILSEQMRNNQLVAMLPIVREIFAMFDADGDGKLNKEEYTTYIKASGEWGKSAEYTEETWDGHWPKECEVLESNANGITREGFESILYGTYRFGKAQGDLDKCKIWTAQSSTQVETEWERIQRIRSTRGTSQQGPVRTNQFTFDGSAGSIPNFNNDIQQNQIDADLQSNIQQNQIDADLQYAIELDKKCINKFLEIINKAEYDIYIYWINEYNKDYTNEKSYDLKYIKYIENNKLFEIMGKYGDQYVITKTYFGKKPKFCNINTDDIIKIISIKNIKGTHTIVDKRSELMKWKSATLKSKKILDDIEKYGKGSSDIIDALLDCIQDINYPTITEEDKEHGGVSSILTNVCTMTDINENVNAGDTQTVLMSSNPHLLNNNY